MYISGTGIISPQHSFNHESFLQNMAEHQGEQMRCIEPDYKELLDPRLIRRMSRIIKFGTAAAMDCMNDAGWNTVDAIVTGTAYGCLEDTGVFLSRMVEHDEQMLTPTAFIQSTHNTIGAQIGLSLKSHSYNNTFVHRGFSFEHALVDAQMLFREHAAKRILAGAADEITAYSHAVLRRFNIYRKDGANIHLIQTPGKGTMAGEGASFFALHSEPTGNDYAKIDELKTILIEGHGNMESVITGFLAGHSIDVSDIGLVLMGFNGDEAHDAPLQKMKKGIFGKLPVFGFKQFCGEYPTSSAFALWMAANICKEGKLPPTLADVALSKPLRVLIYNVDLIGHHSLILVSSC